MPAPGHSLLPPSSAFRWTLCTASIGFVAENDAILPPSGGKEADEGTRAHAYLTYLLQKHLLMQGIVEVVPDNDEMDTLMKSARDKILKFVYPDTHLLVDLRVPLFYMPSQTGTLDVAVVGREPKRGIFYDLKYGVGVSVYAERNKQLAIYAESQIRLLEQVEEDWPDNTPVMLIIDQPRDRNDSNRFRSWPITRGELRRFCQEEIEPSAQIILSGGPVKFHPGEPCKFCRATGICKAYATQGLTAISDEPVDMIVAGSAMKQLVSPNALTREQRQKVLASKAVLIDWLEAVENQEVHDLLNGAKPIEHKLVAGKSNRFWKDPRAATAILLKYAPAAKILPVSEPELLSPKQVEDLRLSLSEDDDAALKALIGKPDGKPTLVPVSDKRPALVINKTEGLEVLPVDPNSLV